MKTKFVGTWRLISFKRLHLDGRVKFPLGQEAVGLLMYDPKGFMAVQLMRPDRPSLKAKDGFLQNGNFTELKATFEGYLSYYGKYEVKENGIIAHYLEACSFPFMVGTEQKRRYRLEGEELELSLPVNRDEKDYQMILNWKRIH